MSQKDYAYTAMKKFQSTAEQYLHDTKKAGDLINKARAKAQNKGPISEVWKKLQLLISITKDWFNGNYKDIPTRSIVMIIIALIYFVSPIDSIPDFIPVAGLIDDASVIAFTVSQINADLEKYKQWKNEQKELA